MESAKNICEVTAMALKAVLFDLDNTLIPWNKDWDLNIKMSLEEVGIKISQEEFEKLKLSLKEYRPSRETTKLCSTTPESL